MTEFAEFKLPEPDTRLVVFGKTVFKIKYKTSNTLLPEDEVTCKTKWFYDELRTITKAVLTQITRSGCTVPLRSEHLAVYPESHLWESVSGLQFSHNGEQLEAHPNVVLFLVKLLAPTSGASSAAPQTNGKRRLPLEDERLPPDGVPSSYHLARKRLRPESGPPLVLPGGCGGALPTGTCTDVGRPVLKTEGPSVKIVSCCASNAMRGLRDLSQPTELKDAEDQKWLNPWRILKSLFQPVTGALQSKS